MRLQMQTAQHREGDISSTTVINLAFPNGPASPGEVVKTSQENLQLAQIWGEIRYVTQAKLLKSFLSSKMGSRTAVRSE